MHRFPLLFPSLGIVKFFCLVKDMAKNNGIVSAITETRRPGRRLS